MVYRGQTIQLEGDFKNFDRVTWIDPTEVYVEIRDPTGTLIGEVSFLSGAITRVTTGIYFGYYTVPVDGTVGDWKFIWTITYTGYTGKKKDIVRIEALP